MERVGGVGEWGEWVSVDMEWVGCGYGVGEVCEWVRYGYMGVSMRCGSGWSVGEN